MSVTFTAANRITRDGHELIAPVRAADHLSVNVSNGNAFMVLERLGFDTDLWGDVDGAEFLGRALVANVGRDDSGVAAATLTSPGSATVIDCGVRDGYFDDVMGRLAALATHAADNGWMVSWA